MKILIIGAGLSGTVFSRLAAEENHKVHIVDKRSHIGGNCYTYNDSDSGVEVHKYGPHIFHTNSQRIWDFVNKFTDFNNFRNRVKAVSNGSLYSLPINLHTINQFYGLTLSPDEAKSFIDSKRYSYKKFNNFEEYVLGSLGKDLYEAFFKYYTIKQWGVDPKLISVSTANRLPIRYNYNDNYFNDIYQGIPVDGYTSMFNKMLDHKNIIVDTNTSFSDISNNWRSEYDLLVYTGSIDEYFQYKEGELPYRTVDFKEIRDSEIQGNAVINYTDSSVKYTRIHEHKWFTPEKKFSKSIGFYEFSSATTSKKNPYYPISTDETSNIFQKYKKLAQFERDVIFVGRLAEYKYYNMDQVIASSISAFDSWSRSK